MSAQRDFTHKHVPAFGRKVHRLGIACNYGIEPKGFEEALERGVSYVFWTHSKTGKIAPSLRAALARKREDVMVATGPTLGWFGGSVRRAAEKQLKKLGTDYIDVFQLFWLGVGAAWSEGTVDELVKLREEGKVKSIGVSIHDRPRAGKLAADSPLDMLMIRYNAAHPGAEREIFPHLAERKGTPPAIVAYTATSWRKLLKKPGGWDGPPMTPGECYRFCLSSPHVDVVLCGAKSGDEVKQNLAEIEKGPLSEEEMKRIRAFGHAVHG